MITLPMMIEANKIENNTIQILLILMNRSMLISLLDNFDLNLNIDTQAIVEIIKIT